MNKKDLTEADIRTKFITPALVGPAGDKWNVMTQFLEEVYITRGRVIVRGQTVKRGEAKKLDYLLFYKPGTPLAVLEAKDNNHSEAFDLIRHVFTGGTDPIDVHESLRELFPKVTAKVRGATR